MAKLKKRVHKDTMKIAGMVAKNKSPKVAEAVVKKHKLAQHKRKPTEPNNTPTHAKKANLYKPPAAEEWRALQEGVSQSHYNFFKLQSDEFLTAVHRKQDRVTVAFDKWLATFNAFLSTLKSSDDKFDLTDKLSFMKTMKLPFDMSTQGLKGSFKFAPPKGKAYAIGSHTISASIPVDNAITVDVAVEMPKEFFQTADYLNFTYHYKKALYICYVLNAAGKKRTQLDLSNAQFMFLEDSPMHLVVVVPIKQDEAAKINLNVQLHFCMEAGVYKLNRFIPERNNIRALTIDSGLTEDVQAHLNNVPTYHYNNAILRDLIVQENHKLISTLTGKFPAVADALILLKYWLRRRRLNSVLSSYSLTMFMCHLIKAKKVNPTAMSYYQIIRIFFSHFHLTDMTKEMTLHDNAVGGDKEGVPPSVQEIKLYSELCFMDVTGFYNIFSKVRQNDMKRIVLESGKALQMLDKSLTNAFQWLFLSDAPDVVVFDHLFQVVLKQGILKHLTKFSEMHLQKLQLYGLAVHEFFVDLIECVLNRGLDNRVVLLQQLRLSNRCWRVTDVPPLQNNAIMFGLILNPENAFEVIVKGPQANEDSASEFRDFWGEKSQLRRFKDGSITEACVFGSSEDSPSEKRMVTEKIVDHLITEHLRFLNEASDNSEEQLWTLQYYGNQLNNELFVEAGNQKYEIRDLETQSLKVIRVFNEVEIELRRLEGLPLDITGILGTSPIFFYSDPRKNFPNGFCSWDLTLNSEIICADAVYDAVLTLAVSGKWPEDVEAMRRLKAAFYMEITERLRKVKGFFCRVAVDCVLIMKSGFVFRFKLAHSKELQLMKQSHVEGVIVYRDTPESLAMEKELFIKPTLASALHGLHQQHNAFGPTVCLAKKWLNAQLLDQGQWPDECTELLVASQFLDDMKTVTSEGPVQPQMGFMRFLHMVANKNWQTEFILLNFNDMLTAEQIGKIQSHFTMNRSQYPPVTIITSFDEKFTGIWSKEAPILQVLVRVIMLAKETLSKLVEKVYRRDGFSNQSVFATKVIGYDHVIHISTEKLLFLKKNIMQSGTRFPADFNPITIYLQELRSAYGEVALFFYNSITPTKIGVIWKPAVDVPRDFRISDVNSRYLVDNQLVFDKEAMCRDFLLIGLGIAVQID